MNIKHCINTHLTLLVATDCEQCKYSTIAARQLFMTVYNITVDKSLKDQILANEHSLRAMLRDILIQSRSMQLNTVCDIL